MRKRHSQTQRAFRGPSPWIFGICTLLVLNRFLGIDRWLLVGIRENELIDKTGHFLFFGLLTFLVLLTLRSKSGLSTGRAVMFACLFVGFLGLLDEASQYWLTERTLDPWDLGANLLGTIILGPTALLIPLGTADKDDPYAETAEPPHYSMSKRSAALQPRLGMSTINQAPNRNGTVSHQPRLSRDQKGRQLL